MKSAIEEIFYGNWGGTESVKNSADCKRQADETERLELKLEELLKENPAALEAFEKFKEALDEVICLEVRDFYKAGFRNGVRLIIDAFGEG